MQRHFAGADRALQLAALADERRHQLAEPLLRRMPRDQAQRLGQLGFVAGACSGDHRFDGIGDRLRGAALLDHGEFGRHPGFERKTAQQRLAEGVDRRDLGAARGVEHAGEKLPGPRNIVVLRHMPGQRHQLFGECARRQCGPGGEPVVDPVGHLRRRGAGEGQAQDPRRVGAVEHQRQQAIGQHPGLAGAGRGGDPDRGRRIQGCLLRGGRRAGPAHGSPSPSSRRSSWR